MGVSPSGVQTLWLETPRQRETRTPVGGNSRFLLVVLPESAPEQLRLRCLGGCNACLAGVPFTQALGDDLNVFKPWAATGSREVCQFPFTWLAGMLIAHLLALGTLAHQDAGASVRRSPVASGRGVGEVSSRRLQCLLGMPALRANIDHEK